MTSPEGLCHIRYGRSHVERFIDLILYTGSPARTPKMRQNGLAPLSFVFKNKPRRRASDK